MAYRSLLLDRIPDLVHKHFGKVPECVVYRGGLPVPLDVGLDCKELAKTVLSEEANLAEVFSVEDVARNLESIIVTTVREGTNRIADLIDRLCNRLEMRDEWKLVLI